MTDEIDDYGAVEAELIWQLRDQLTYNNQGKQTPPDRRVTLEHGGDSPRLPGGGD